MSVNGQPHEMRSGLSGNSWMSAEKILRLCTFAFHGPGVPLIIKIVAELESSDNLRSELYTPFLSGME